MFLSAHRDIISRSKAAALKDGAVAMLEKPARAADLLDAIHRALKRPGAASTRSDLASGDQAPSV